MTDVFNFYNKIKINIFAKAEKIRQKAASGLKTSFAFPGFHGRQIEKINDSGDHRDQHPG